MLTIDQVKNKLQKMLIEINGGIEIDSDGDFKVVYESANVFARVFEFGPDDNKSFSILFFCPLIRDVPITHELCLHIATEEFRFGSLRLTLKESQPEGNVDFQFGILADDLDQSEVKNALYAVLFTSNQLDDELKEKFGGRLFSEN
jgi:hypothetical protein